MSEEHVGGVNWLAELCRRALANVVSFGGREAEIEAGWSVHRLKLAMDGAPVDPSWPDSVKAALR